MLSISEIWDTRSTGIILCVCPANKRRYIVTLYLIGGAHIQNDPQEYTQHIIYNAIAYTLI